MSDHPEAIKRREEHQEFARAVSEATDAMETVETVLPQNWFGRLTLRWFSYLRRIWAEEEEARRLDARETYDRDWRP